MTSVNNEFIVDMWNTLVTYIPAKEKLAAAESVIKLCDEFGFTSVDLYDIIDDNKILEAAHSRYFADEFDEDEFDDDY